MSTFRAAIIINTDDPEPLRMMRESFVSIFERLVPTSKLDFYNGIVDTDLLSILDEDYDLLVIGGCTYIVPHDTPWMLRLRDFEIKLYCEHPEQKVVGICLGHQTSALNLGGDMDFLPGGPQLAVKTVKLTDAGKAFFGKSSTLDIHKFHQRAVNVIQPGFEPLAENNEILMSNNGNVVTFQGHPEMTGEMMKYLLLDKRSVASGYVNREIQENQDSAVTRALLEKADLSHDGLDMWRSIIGWVTAGMVNGSVAVR
ncbi:class I glutamine amidotransferase-like protein [Xylariaceae sp. FL1272]|nr:class I glutamine amidotransferase-like protein [Xylariaceae sp. FL1272]